jgi:hypothetical protein
MNIPFEQLEPTTHTMIYYLKGNINYGNAFWFLPVNFTYERTEGRRPKIIPVKGNPGDINHIIHKGMSRGIFESAKTGQTKRDFKNAMLLTISTQDKLITLKISPKTIHVTGVKKESQADEAINFMLEHLNRLNDSLKFPSKEALAELSDTILPELDSELNSDNIERLVSLCKIDCLKEILRNWLSSETKDKIAFFLSSIKNIDPDNFSVIDNLSVIEKTTVMANYSYSLGFRLDRLKFSEKIRQFGFITRFNPASDFLVTVNSIYTKPDSIHNKKKEGKHSLMVYSAGKVTQSGPGGEEMRRMYYKFLESVSLIKDEIIEKD